MFDMLLKSLGLTQEKIDQYMTGLANGVQEIRAGISSLITSDASIIARLEAIEAILSAQNPPKLNGPIENAQIKPEDTKQ